MLSTTEDTVSVNQCNGTQYSSRTRETQVSNRSWSKLGLQVISLRAISFIIPVTCLLCLLDNTTQHNHPENIEIWFMATKKLYVRQQQPSSFCPESTKNGQLIKAMLGIMMKSSASGKPETSVVNGKNRTKYDNEAYNKEASAGDKLTTTTWRWPSAKQA